MQVQKRLFAGVLLFTFFAGDVVLVAARGKAKNDLHRYKPEEITVCNTIPKSGTHLLLKCINALRISGFNYKVTTGQKEEVILKIRELNKLPPPNHYKGSCHIPTVGELPQLALKGINNRLTRGYWLHWPYTKKFDNYLKHNSGPNFFTIRDPRDLMVSLAFMIRKHSDGRFCEDFEKLLLDLIDGRMKYYVPWGVEILNVYPLVWEYGLVRFIEMYLPWMQCKNFYTVRFENLIGPRGGGSLEAQITEIMNIAKHLKKIITPEEAKAVGEEIFGNTWTFREGKLGSWKQHFTPLVKETFKKTPGANQLLIRLGYEKDDSW